MRWVVAALVVGIVLSGCRAAAPRPGPGAAATSGTPVTAPATREEKRALFARAHQQVEAKQYAAAAPALAALLPVYPELQDYCLHDLALSRAGMGDQAAAAALWAQLVATHPQSVFVPRAALERGRILRAQGDLRGAETQLTAARDAGDQEIAMQAWLELADIALRRDDPAGAAAALLAARRIAPGTPTARRAAERLAALRAQHPELTPAGDGLEEELQLRLAERDFAGAQQAAAALLATAAPERRPDILRRRADAELGAGDREAGLATLQEIVRQYPSAAAAPEAQFRYATLLWNRDRNIEAARAFEEFGRRYPAHARMPEVRYALARIDQSDGRVEAAVAGYTTLAETYPSHALAHEARWRVGWIRYQQGRWRDAAAAFAAAAGGRDAAAAADAYYWQARALERAGDRGGAERVYLAVLTTAPNSYYAHWAAQHAAVEPDPPATAVGRPAPTIAAPPAGTDPYHWTRAGELNAAGMPALARGELRAFERAHAGQPALTQPLLDAYGATDGYRDAIRVATARSVGDAVVLYPLAFWPQVSSAAHRQGVDPLLVLALMRQESLFDPAAQSSADARGLMQLLPGTAERVARSSGQAAPDGRLYEPEVNITLGVAYLSGLMQDFHGDPLRSLAAYNGGEDAVARWQQRFGHLEPDEFVESITYRETRDYVKKVMGNYWRYQRIYGPIS